MVTIELQQLKLHAFHGIYEGEQKTGSTYEINAKVSYDEGNTTFDELKNTVNYVDILAIIKQRMLESTGLLEKMANGIIVAIKQQYPFVTEAMITIYKLEAPVENFQGKLGVTMHKKFDA
jgi:dihydroneopterin aldolase